MRSAPPFRRLAALWHDRTGTSVIEMSIILPVLVVMVCGAADVGMAFLQQIRIQQAAARTMEMALAYRSPTATLSTTIIHDEGATGYGIPVADTSNQVVADMWLEGAGVRQTNYTDVCATGSPARFASVAITDNHAW
ncbi:MAG: pilus assembly protein, partial [Sphingomonadales bacterium]|nr:pilus assembly protein [Sphingomonadales bacterium]